ncbi:isoaspartyl peptidase/L-asparaginase family protein [Funiculus sociatus GB2-A5]|uniref:Isoaspartyl peptidase/L-asparaginase family protein n=1 Tax=Funiculus sociatus GB2-A5 TaxID=2933946 RepID=A0ABV0JLU5_9CYAN|nr:MULTISPECIES: isoaspartyl peptidase/L-asparaginase family protein [unclassified Trichocoleus]MBD1907176.1 isoaspartyl peptidase/L-asparaginase [Trichocoleus sp. FACHB-832]MBD2064219.1 isoaspartyl peptidase/L-asparaginase [Trichocoleus sp. FACHB-6]
MTIAIIVHGGAKTISEDKTTANTKGCLAAVEAGWAVLEQGGDAKDAVEAAIRVLESDATFNASIGATLDVEGEVYLDAAMMESDKLRWGGVAAVQRIAHPISVARKILEEKPSLLVAEGAERFAAKHGCEMCEPTDLISDEQEEEWEQQNTPHDRPATVGCVALDVNGNLVAGTSTGGLENQLPGRVGDTALVGAGLYANSQGACSTTGDGESIIPVGLARTAVDLLAGNSPSSNGSATRHPEEAAQMAIDKLKQQVSGEAGCIVLDPHGQIGWAYNSQDMAVGYRSSEMDQAAVFTKKEDERFAKSA